jgi:outer membrane protein assembly factor BamB
MGLHPEDLSTVWEQPDPEEAWTAHGSYLCRMTEVGWLESLELPSLRQIACVRPHANLGISAVHVHHGDSWCHFGVTEGGRTAIDLKSGEVVWASSEPVGYGLIAFDGATVYSSFHGLSAYDLATGRRLWMIDLPNVSSRPSIHRGRVYVATADGFVRVADAMTGTVIATHRVDYKDSGLGFEPSPVVPIGDVHIVVGTRREIICLETS